MMPALRRGDLIIIQKQIAYQLGDIITFTNPLGGKRGDTITHRLVGSLVTLSKTLIGLVLLIILPGTMIAYAELVNIANELRKLIRKPKPIHETKS